MHTGRFLTLRLLTLAAIVVGALTFAAPARPVSAAPVCSSTADTPFINGGAVASRHTVFCNAIMGSITVNGRLRLNNVTVSAQSATCLNTSICTVWTRYPFQHGAWYAVTTGSTAGPAVAVPATITPVVNL